MDILTQIAKEMYAEVEAKGFAYRELQRGLKLKIKSDYSFSPTFVHLTMARKTNGEPWPDDKEKEIKIIRQAFDIPRVASQYEDKNGGKDGDYYTIRFGWHQPVEQPALI